jgi:uncharacterized protein
VFSQFPRLKVVLMESGFGWVPSFLWRADKEWRSLRAEVPWVKERPSDIFRRHVRITCQPFDRYPSANELLRTLELIGADDMLLFSSDFPHWQFDGDEVIPRCVPPHIVQKMKCENPYRTYPRLAKVAA